MEINTIDESHCQFDSDYRISVFSSSFGPEQSADYRVGDTFGKIYIWSHDFPAFFTPSEEVSQPTGRNDIEYVSTRRNSPISCAGLSCASYHRFKAFCSCEKMISYNFAEPSHCYWPCPLFRQTFFSTHPGIRHWSGRKSISSTLACAPLMALCSVHP